MQVQQDAEDAGDAGAGGTQPRDAGVPCAAGTADQTAEEGPEAAQVPECLAATRIWVPSSA